MNSDSDRLDGVIDEALCALTSGEPAEGLGGRVLEQVDTEAEPAWRGYRRVSSLRASSLRWATVVALAVVALASSLVVSRFVHPRPKDTRQTAALTTRPAPFPRADVVANAPAPGTVSAPMVNRTPRPLPNQAQIPRDVPGLSPAAVHEETDPDAGGGIVPLSAPKPIADRPIEITPLVIQPVVNREIQIPLIETDRSQKGPGQTDKR